MAKIIYDDWTEKDFNQEDYISREDLAELYVSKEDIEDNYVTREKYDKVKAQRRDAYRKAASKEDEVKHSDSESVSKDEIMFSIKHGFDWAIPQEISEVKTKHPTLSWEDAYKLSGYEVATSNPNPWIANPKVINGSEKVSYTVDEIANLSQSEYNEVMAKAEAWTIKIQN